MGNPYQLTPKARLLSWLGFGFPFDRHDWYVDRGGTPGGAPGSKTCGKKAPRDATQSWRSAPRAAKGASATRQRTSAGADEK